MSTWTSAIFALIGVVVGGVLSYLANLHKTRIEKTWERDRNILDKLEELYSLTEEVSEGFTFTASQGMMKARYDKKPDDHSKIPIAKMKMLVVMYAPEATPLIIAFDEAWNQFSKHYSSAITSSKLQKSQAQILSQQLFDSSDKISDVCQQIQACTLDIVKSLKVSRTK